MNKLRTNEYKKYIDNQTYGYGLTFFRNKGNVENPVNLTWRKRS